MPVTFKREVPPATGNYLIRESQGQPGQVGICLLDEEGLVQTMGDNRKSDPQTLIDRTHHYYEFGPRLVIDFATGAVSLEAW